MVLPKEQELASFSKKRHKKYVEQAVFEGAAALIPGVLGGIAYFSLRSTQTVQEAFAPSKPGVVAILLPILLMLYAVFVLYVWYDVIKRIQQA